MAVVSGTAGGDVLTGTSSGETLNGLDGNDTLAGLGGDDVLDGGVGYDTADYRGAGAGVTVNLESYPVGALGQGASSGDGNDFLFSIEAILGSAFDDEVRGNGDDNIIDGNAGDDVLIGSTGSDTLRGGDGDDLLFGAIDQSDTSVVGDGADLLEGGAGDDLLRGNFGNDQMFGGDGNDNLRGGAGDDLYDGGAGYDFASFIFSTASGSVSLDATRIGTEFETVFISASGTDTLRSIEHIGIIGTEFSDTLLGSFGGDQLTGGGGNDSIAGGEGSDYYLLGGAGDDTIDGGAGVDSAYWLGSFNQYTITRDASTGAITVVDLGSGFNEGTDTLHNVDVLEFSGSTHTVNELFALAPTPPRLLGVAPANEGVGVALNSDIVLTFDKVIGRGAGTLILRDTIGNVVESFDAATSTRMSLSGIVLTINPSADLESGTIYNLDFIGGGVRDLAGVDFAGSFGYHFITATTGALVRGTAENDMVGGSSDNDTLIADAGNDTVNGGAGNDVLDGGSGSDLLTGGAGSDILIGGAGDDRAEGGTGADIYFVDSAGDLVVELDNAAALNLGQRVDLDLGNTIDKVVASVNYSLTAFVENLSLSGGAGDLSGAGNALDNVLVGNEGRNRFTGHGGNDTLDGGAGVDTALYSGARADYALSGGSDGFTLASKTGADGTDRLRNVERLQFSDGGIALDVTASQAAGQTQLLAGAVLGKSLLATKQALIGSVLTLFDQGYTLRDLAGAAMRLDIWGTLAGGNSAAQIATYLLTTVNQGVPDANSLTAAVNSLTNDPQGDFLWHLAESAANQVQVGLAGLAATGLPYEG